MSCLDHWLLRVGQQVVESVVAHEFIESDDTLGLLAHGALEEVSRRLVVMGVRDDTCHNSHNSVWVDL